MLGLGQRACSSEWEIKTRVALGPDIKTRLEARLEGKAGLVEQQGMLHPCITGDTGLRRSFRR